ncbi:FKBP-type peptidyl-prolyl cis-trans isomerase FklB [Filimonas lacunae]|uniref:Peptidyl-prolyl cis-trans isomerase n=1 Tax=Filimonas lacunae TaxID=477680 RepID=A0A173MFT6_9BACT|nr:FKBP-type peptidyl-prolyl cis-trans isomerase [Filimonas lacunae]BAV06350.1 FKBP-type peptidyl-prolyl cis-trans isomerase FklB [Filimonas lacunae]SIT26573.1 FKBP-type peptidyl-prolyl cis-trans isomerase FklB [Filimonas lacunae]
MKKIIVTFGALAALSGAFAQTKTTKPATGGVKKTTTKPATASGTQNITDTFSYAIAMSTASFFKDKGVNQVNMAMVQKAFEDVMKKNQPALTQEQMNQSIMNRMQSLQKDKTAVAHKQGQAFLAANKTKPGVVTTASGLQYTIIKEGTGPKPKLTDKVKVHYHGTLTDGTVFDSSVDRGTPIDLNVNGVIAGWTEALQMMPVGSKWKLFIPSELAYGDRDAGPTIKGGSALIFDVELLAIDAPETGANQ